MANAKEIKRKIVSIKNTQKITKAMELISTVKMKKAQDLVLSKKEFMYEIYKIFKNVDKFLDKFPLFSPGKGEKTLAVLVTSNRGLCGGYNINIMKKVNAYIKETGENIDYVTIGKKAANFIAKTGNNLIADFSHDFTDYIEPYFTKEIAVFLREEFLSGKYKKVIVFYNYYVNTIKQIPLVKTTLPINSVEIEKFLTSVLEGYSDFNNEDRKLDDYELEPNADQLAKELTPMILDMMFNNILLEAKASEHSSRMIAMKGAKDNAGKIAGDLTLMYNKARQALITREVSEITAGVESMKDV